MIPLPEWIKHAFYNPGTHLQYLQLRSQEPEFESFRNNFFYRLKKMMGIDQNAPMELIESIFSYHRYDTFCEIMFPEAKT